MDYIVCFPHDGQGIITFRSRLTSVVTSVATSGVLPTLNLKLYPYIVLFSTKLTKRSVKEIFTLLPIDTYFKDSYNFVTQWPFH